MLAKHHCSGGLYVEAVATFETHAVGCGSSVDGPLGVAARSVVVEGAVGVVYGAGPDLPSRSLFAVALHRDLRLWEQTNK